MASSSRSTDRAITDWVTPAPLIWWHMNTAWCSLNVNVHKIAKIIVTIILLKETEDLSTLVRYGTAYISMSLVFFCPAQDAERFRRNRISVKTLSKVDSNLKRIRFVFVKTVVWRIETADRSMSFQCQLKRSSFLRFYGTSVKKLFAKYVSPH